MEQATAHRYVVLAFMAAVTCYLLGRAFAEMGTGLGGALEALVYSVTAAFGLEYLISTWRSLWRER
jgi:hypothetical protein